MSRRVGVQPAEKAQFVDVLGQVRVQFGNPGAGFAMLRELEFRAGEDAAAGPDLAVILCSCGLYSQVSICEMPLP